MWEIKLLLIAGVAAEAVFNVVVQDEVQLLRREAAVPHVCMANLMIPRPAYAPQIFSVQP